MNSQTKIFKQGYKPKLSEGSLVTPIFKTSTFCFNKAEDGERSFEIAYGLDSKRKDEDPCLIYTRVNNPNMEIVEDKLALIDNTESSLVFSSGMGAVSTTCLTFLKPGDSLIFSNPVYGGTDYFFNHYLPSIGVTCKSFPSGANFDEIMKVAKSCNNLKIIYIETPCNPLIKLTSLKIVEEVKSKLDNVISVIDNTFNGPYYLRPINFGCDIILYSISKFIGGHSDLIAGSISGKLSLLSKIKGTRTILGNILDPDSCWLIQRSLATLKMRMEKQCENAKKIVKNLASHKKIKKLYYPGIGDDNQQMIFKEEYLDSGSIISFELNGTKEDSFKLLNSVEIFSLAVSLGSVESLIQHPSSMTHSDLSKDQKLEAGISETLIRCSIGVEDCDDLINDLTKALDNL